MEKISKNRIKEMPISDRPMERLAKFGPEALSEEDFLAILIGSGTQKQNALELAASLLQGEAGRSWILHAQTEELMAYPGIGFSKACRIVAAAHLFKRLHSYEKFLDIRLNQPDKVAAYFQSKLAGEKREHFCTLLLDVKMRPIRSEIIAIGTLTQAPVHPREVFRTAIALNAVSILFAHNHPSGNPEPSPEDIQLTKRLAKAGEILGIKVQDHLILSDHHYVSMRQQGLFS